MCFGNLSEVLLEARDHLKFIGGFFFGGGWCLFWMDFWWFWWVWYKVGLKFGSILVALGSSFVVFVGVSWSLIVQMDFYVEASNRT